MAETTTYTLFGERLDRRRCIRLAGLAIWRLFGRFWVPGLIQRPKPTATEIHASPLGLQKGQVEAARILLLEARADSESVTEKGWTALHLACKRGYPAVVQLLINAGANLGAKEISHNWTALHFAALQWSLGNCPMCLSVPVHLWTCMRIPLGATPLLLACQEGHLEIVQALLAAGANLRARTLRGHAALHYASKNGHLGVVKVLLDAAGIEIDAVDNFGNTPLLLACSTGKLEVVRELLKQGAGLFKQNNRQCYCF